MVAARNMSYRDGLNILQGKDGRIADRLDRMLGGLIIASSLIVSPTALALIGAKNELKKISDGPVANLAAAMRGLVIADRARRIEAANTVILITSLLDATKEIIGEDWDHLEVTDEEVGRLLGHDEGINIDGTLSEVVHFAANAELPLPETVRPFSETLDDVKKFATEYASRLVKFTQGLQFRNSLGAAQRVEFDDELRKTLPGRVAEKYQQSIFRLAGEVAELAVWLDLREHQASREAIKLQIRELHESTRIQLGATHSLLNRLGEVLLNIEKRRVSTTSRWLEGLRTRYEAELNRPMLENAEEAEIGIQVPKLGDAFIDPAYKIAIKTDGTVLPGSEDWWSELEPRSDLMRTMTGYLTSPRSLEVPLLILGHPGAGKSTIAKILASEIGRGRLLPIYVPLRNVTATATIASQISEALFLTLQEQVSWPDMLASAPEAHPIVILDGFDELIQATGASQSHYLEQVREFQENSKMLNRPISVIVTSRTVVADRARIPRGVVVIKLEPFDSGRIGAWVKKWNAENESAFRIRNILPVDIKVVLRYKEISSHPVLLLMLALYDSDGNPLTRDGSDLVGSALYERLFVRFVKREVLNRLDGRQLDSAAIHKKIEEELYYLAIAALSMFNRGRQVVLEDELESDLCALIESKADSGNLDLNARISNAQRLVRSFYFVNKSEAGSVDFATNVDSERQSRRRAVTARSFEFIHATFGEYLVARNFVNLLESTRRMRPAIHPWQKDEQVIDDELLRALYSHQSFAKRRQTLIFLAEMPIATEVKTRITAIIPDLLQRALWTADIGTAYKEYAPQVMDTTKRCATYSVNLILAFAAIEGKIDLRQIMRGAKDTPLRAWRNHVLLWESRLDRDEWTEVAQILEWTDRAASAEFRFCAESHVRVLNESLDTRLAEIGDSFDSVRTYANGSVKLDEQMRRTDLALDAFDRLALDVVDHMSRTVGDIASTQFVSRFSDIYSRGEGVFSELSGVLGATFLARLAYPVLEDGPSELANDYERLLHYFRGTFTYSWNARHGGFTDPSRSFSYILPCLRRDCEILPPLLVQSILSLALDYGSESVGVHYYAEIVRICGRVLRNEGSGHDFLSIAVDAFARLDASHLIEMKPAFMIGLVVQFADDGVPMDEVTNYGRLEDWFDMFDLVEIGNTKPGLVRRVFSAAHERKLDAWVGRKAVEIFPLLSKRVLDRFEDLEFFYVFSAVHSFKALPLWEVETEMVSRFENWASRYFSLDFLERGNIATWLLSGDKL